MRTRKKNPGMYRLGEGDALLHKYEILMDGVERKQRLGYLPLFAEYALDIAMEELEGEEEKIADVEAGVVCNAAALALA